MTLHHIYNEHRIDEIGECTSCGEVTDLVLYFEASFEGYCMPCALAIQEHAMKHVPEDFEGEGN